MSASKHLHRMLQHVGKRAHSWSYWIRSGLDIDVIHGLAAGLSSPMRLISLSRVYKCLVLCKFKLPNRPFIICWCRIRSWIISSVMLGFHLSESEWVPGKFNASQILKCISFRFIFSFKCQIVVLNSFGDGSMVWPGYIGQLSSTWWKRGVFHSFSLYGEITS